jgi:hypothetical protein
MDSAKILDLADKFISITASSDHYNQIIAVYKSIQNIVNAVTNAKNSDGSEDEGVNSQVSRLNQLARRLVYNADVYGVSAQTSSRYGNEIKRGVDQILSRVRNLNPYSDIHIMVGRAAENAQNALQSYKPRSLSSQRAPQQNEQLSMPEETIHAQPPEQAPVASFDADEELARTQREMDAERTGLPPSGIISYGPYTQSPPVPQESGMAKQQQRLDHLKKLAND